MYIDQSSVRYNNSVLHQHLLFWRIYSFYQITSSQFNVSWKAFLIDKNPSINKSFYSSCIVYLHSHRVTHTLCHIEKPCMPERTSWCNNIKIFFLAAIMLKLMCCNIAWLLGLCDDVNVQSKRKKILFPVLNSNDATCVVFLQLPINCNSTIYVFD